MVDKEGSFEIRKVQLRKYFYHTAYLSRYSERIIMYMAMGMSQTTENVVITSYSRNDNDLFFQRLCFCEFCHFVQLLCMFYIVKPEIPNLINATKHGNST